MTKQEIGAIIRQEREAQKMTQTALARKMMMSRGKVFQSTQVNGIEQANVGYTIDLLIGLCDILGLEVTITKRD